MIKRIKFPKQASVAYIDHFLSAIREVIAVQDSRIDLDFSQTTELSALAICFLCGLIDLAVDKNNHGKIILPRNRRAAQTLRSVKLLINTPGRPKIKIAERMLQVRRIDGANSAVIQDMLEALSYNLPIQPEATSSITVILNELLTNAIDHSGESRCYLCIGSWGKSKYLHIAFLDFGIGIPNKLRTRYPNFVEDIAAIKGVLQQKLTVREDRVGGKGYELIQDALKQNGGRLHIFSGKGKAIIKYDKREYNFKKAREPFNGTCIDIQYNLVGSHFYEKLHDISEKFF